MKITFRKDYRLAGSYPYESTEMVLEVPATVQLTYTVLRATGAPFFWDGRRYGAGDSLASFDAFENEWEVFQVPPTHWSDIVFDPNV